MEHKNTKRVDRMKNCFNCHYIENIGIDTDLWKCNKGIFNKLEEGVCFLSCGYFEEDREI